MSLFLYNDRNNIVDVSFTNEMLPYTIMEIIHDKLVSIPKNQKHKNQ